MATSKGLDLDLYSVNEHSFADIARQVFHFQAEGNDLYQRFISLLERPANPSSLSEIPFLPISFFKSHAVKTGAWESETVFRSSGTTGIKPSTHHVRSLETYLKHAERCFEHFFGPLNDYHFLALLPSYLERNDSSLVSMINRFIQKSRSNFSGFYLDNTKKLVADLENLRSEPKKTVLWGVSFALMDLAERYNPNLGHCLIFETGGMKGRRAEVTRDALHAMLKEGLSAEIIYSEYGMTELFSQAYSRGKNRFYCPPWMKIIVRDLSDPLRKGLLNETGGINVIDLANFDTISFIETEDLGRLYEDGSFEILGRIDNSEIRGCNLLVG